MVSGIDQLSARAGFRLDQVRPHLLLKRAELFDARLQAALLKRIPDAVERG